jgi:hypothetical protein
LRSMTDALFGCISMNVNSLVVPDTVIRVIISLSTCYSWWSVIKFGNTRFFKPVPTPLTLWSSKLVWIKFKYSARTLNESLPLAVTKNHAEPMNALSGQNVELVNVKTGGIYNYHWPLKVKFAHTVSSSVFQFAWQCLFCTLISHSSVGGTVRHSQHKISPACPV